MSQNHDHVFLGERHGAAERKVWLVIGLTLVTMVVEIIAGAWFGSMALTADGWHMATHAAALLIAALAYLCARRYARDPRFTFGAGKIGNLAAFANAMLLGLIALLIGWESLVRLWRPEAIRYDEALLVATLGLLVNIASAWLLRDDHSHHGRDHGHDHDHDHGHDHDHEHAPHQDQNLRAAYMHVLADALTSVFAIVALLLGRSFGWDWADAVIGMAGAVVILRWSVDLVHRSAAVLLDATAEATGLAGRIRGVLTGTGLAVTDLHVWALGPGRYGVIVALNAEGAVTPDTVRSQLASIAGLAHISVEINGRAGA